MGMIRLDPPGTHCHLAAARDFLGMIRAGTFVEAGVGTGGLARMLLDRGMRGVGLDVSEEAVAISADLLRDAVAEGRMRVEHADVTTMEPAPEGPFDLGIAMMVMEHVPDDVGFLRAIMRQVRPGGHVLISVPARMDRWSIEDDTVGHLRRYERADLAATLEAAGLRDAVIRSVSVPVANLLHALSNRMIARSAEVEKLGADLDAQTRTSGTREVPFKTVFPPWCRVILNPVALSPLFLLQRAFYRGDRGLELMALARVP